MSEFVHYSAACDTDPDLYREYLRTLQAAFATSFRDAYVASDVVIDEFVNGVGGIVGCMGQITRASRVCAGSGGSTWEQVGNFSSGQGGILFPGRGCCGRDCFQSTSNERTTGQNGSCNRNSDGNGPYVAIGGASTRGRVISESVVDGGVEIGANLMTGGCVNKSQEVVNSDNSDGIRVNAQSDSDAFVSGRGRNWERNQAWRLKKKISKEKKKQMQNDWRACQDVKPVVAERKGFFSSCSEDTQRQLRESRAAALVAKNNLEAARAAQQLRVVNKTTPEMDLARELIRVVEMANKLKRTTKNADIGGWAKTIADSMTKSVAESAPDSVPSLESIGYGKSSLQSSDGSTVESRRLKEYNAEMAEVEREFEMAGFYTDDEYDAAILKVKEKYPEIAYVTEECFKKRYDNVLISKLSAIGLAPYLIDEVLGIDSEAPGVPRYAPGEAPDNDAVSVLIKSAYAKLGADKVDQDEKHWENCRKAAFANGFDRNRGGR